MTLVKTKNILQEPRLAAYGIVRKEDQILLVQLKSGPFQGLWNLPGGKIEFGESPEQALRRELLEEAGLVFDSSRLQTNLSYFSGTIHHIGLIYWVDGFRKIQEGEDDARWFTSPNPDQLTPFAKEISLLLSQE